VPIAFLAFTAITTLLIKRRAQVQQADVPQEEVRAAAG
jgi:hypothetical protein